MFVVVGVAVAEDFELSFGFDVGDGFVVHRGIDLEGEDAGGVTVDGEVALFDAEFEGFGDEGGSRGVGG